MMEIAAVGRADAVIVELQQSFFYFLVLLLDRQVRAVLQPCPTMGIARKGKMETEIVRRVFWVGLEGAKGGHDTLLLSFLVFYFIWSVQGGYSGGSWESARHSWPVLCLAVSIFLVSGLLYSRRGR